MWNVYILLCDQKTFYVGMTDNLNKRLIQHMSGYSPYTKKFSDIRLVYKEIYPKYLQASKREKQLKGWSVAKKNALITGDRFKLKNLSRSHEIVDE